VWVVDLEKILLPKTIGRKRTDVYYKKISYFKHKTADSRISGFLCIVNESGARKTHKRHRQLKSR
jgi:hypothetical protein